MPVAMATGIPKSEREILRVDVGGQITLSVSEGTRHRRNRPFADAWGYLADCQRAQYGIVVGGLKPAEARTRHPTSEIPCNNSPSGFV